MTTTPVTKFLILCGLSFAGKSTLGKAIVERFGFEEVDVDCTKYALYGPGIKDEELKPEDWVRIYTETDKLIENQILAGKTVVDASRNFSKVEREAARQIADKTGVCLITIYVDTPEEIVRQRMLENRVNPTRRDISDNDFEDVIRAMDVPEAAENPLIFHYTDEIESWMVENSAILAASFASIKGDAANIEKDA